MNAKLDVTDVLDLISSDVIIEYLEGFKNIEKDILAIFDMERFLEVMDRKDVLEFYGVEDV